MKKVLAFMIVASLVLAACTGTPAPRPSKHPGDLKDPGFGPNVELAIPSEFNPDPDKNEDPLVIALEVKHVVPIKEWALRISPIRQARAEGQTLTPEQEAERARQSEERAARRQAQAEQEGQPQGQSRRRVFYELTGTGELPKELRWNGKGNNGEMMQSATDYRIVLSVTDVFDLTKEFEGTTSVGVLVKRDDNGDLRIVVPSIVFPPNDSDLSKVAEESDRRANARILRLIARALNRYADYAITIEGHSNPTTAPNTTARTNEETRELKPLSQKRAEAVLDYLVANDGVDRSRLKAVGVGGERTVAAYNDTEENWKNRRVEFLLHR